MRYRWLGLAKVCHSWWLKTNVFYSELCNHITVLNCLLTWTLTNRNYGNLSHLYHPSHMMWTKHQSALEALPPFLSDSRAAVCKISRKRQIVNASSIHNSEGFISTWQESAFCSWLSSLSVLVNFSRILPALQLDPKLGLQRWWTCHNTRNMS